MNSPYPPQAEQQCGNCYYRPGGECRRHAPRPAVGAQACYESCWPEVCDGEWCGEWAPQEVSE